MKIEIKITFEPRDFPGSGQYVILDAYQDGISDPGYGLSVAYKVGWLPYPAVRSPKFDREDGSINCLISLQDGMILQNEAQCLNCNDIIWSGSRHDFKSCKCGNICVDGGQEYIRRVYASNEAAGLMRDRSLTVSDGDAFRWLVKTLEFLMHNRVDDDVVMLLICCVYHKDHNTFQPKCQPEFFDDVLKEIDTMKNSGRNALGVTLSVIRVLRKYKLLDPELFEEPAETVNPE